MRGGEGGRGGDEARVVYVAEGVQGGRGVNGWGREEGGDGDTTNS